MVIIKNMIVAFKPYFLQWKSLEEGPNYIEFSKLL